MTMATTAKQLGESSTAGLTVRELFAAMAMQAIIGGSCSGVTHRDEAAEAIKYADALLAELAKERTP
jgi:hypothetical protein